MPHLPGIDVVVVSYRTPEDLSAYIQSFTTIEGELPAALHVVNVDPTTEDSAAAKTALQDVTAPYTYVEHVENVGYARACNAAASAVSDRAREIIAFFNADTRLAPGVLSHCHQLLMENEDWGIVGPKQVDDNGLITHAGIYGTNEHPSFDGRWKRVDQGQYDELRDDCVTVSGSAYFVKRDCWDGLASCPTFAQVAPDAEGAFLPTPHFYEETWCSYHARSHGWKVAYTGLVGMVHKWHQASPVGGRAEREYLPASRRLFRHACEAHQISHD
jgi:GT2 family glycosyltransferase